MQLFLKLFEPYLQWCYHGFDRIGRWPPNTRPRTKNLIVIDWRKNDYDYD
jgi:hypothetical protein